MLRRCGLVVPACRYGCISELPVPRCCVDHTALRLIIETSRPMSVSHKVSCFPKSCFLKTSFTKFSCTVAHPSVYPTEWALPIKGTLYNSCLTTYVPTLSLSLWKNRSVLEVVGVVLIVKVTAKEKCKRHFADVKVILLPSSVRCNRTAVILLQVLLVSQWHF